jgi:hypothetical protein
MKEAAMPRTTKSGDGATDQPKDRRAVTNKPNGASNGGANAPRGDGGNGAARAANPPRPTSNGEIERRAYEIYQARGGQHGNDIDHWLEAEKQLKPGPTSVTGSISAPRPKKAKKSEAGA